MISNHSTLTTQRVLGVDSLNNIPPRSTLVISPTFNEAKNITDFIESVALAGVADLLIVDDASPDGTADAIRRAAASSPIKIWLMRRIGKHGLGTAYLDGYAWALDTIPEYTVIVGMDADLSHDPAMLTHLSTAALNCGVCVGSRYVRGGGGAPDWPVHRQLLSYWANVYARGVIGLRFRKFQVRDSTSGFIAWHRDALTTVVAGKPNANGYSFLIEIKLLAIRSGYTISEYPIIFSERRQGVSKINTAIIREAVILPWRKLFQT